VTSFFKKAADVARRAGKFLTAGYEAEQDLLRIHLHKPAKTDEPPEITALRRALTDEPLRTQFSRFTSRIARAINYQPIELQDLNVIKLPEIAGMRFFAKRNADDNWNVWCRTGHAQGPVPLRDTLITPNLPVGDALNTLARHGHAAMHLQTHMHWHPQHVAKRIGHVFPDELGHKIPVPPGILPPDNAHKNASQPKPPQK
jgi:hypothetical protein